jgi:hypothetical protein
LVGDRGVGKTVLLNHIQQLAGERGWAVVVEQVVATQPFLSPLLDRVVAEAGTKWAKLSKLAKEVDLDVVLGLNVSAVKAEAHLTSARRVRAAQVVVRKLLTDVGEHATAHGSGLMITIDEAHAIGNRSELAVLASALQLVVKRDRLPVAVYFAGLPSTRQVLRGAGTYFERAGIEEIGELSVESAELALLKPASDAGIAIHDDALGYMIEAAGGYPYLVQLVGYHVWKAKGQRRAITLDDAKQGVHAANKEMGEVFLSRFEPLPPLQQAYVQAAARIGRVAPVAEITAALSRGPDQLNSTRDALINKHRILRSRRYGEVEFVIPAFVPWLVVQPDVVQAAVTSRRDRGR